MAKQQVMSEETFAGIFRMYYSRMVGFCGQFIADHHACEDIVQEVFARLWEDRDSVEIRRSMASYLTARVRNAAIDLLRHNKVREKHAGCSIQQREPLSPEEYVLFADLNTAIRNAVDALAPPLRETLLLSMHHRLTYPQIAGRLGISVRTVESRISKARSFLRKQLPEYGAASTAD